MKISSVQRRDERGAVAVVVIITILAVLMIYSAANVRVLAQLQSELKLLEQRQTQRLAKGAALRAAASGTRTVSATERERN